MCLQVRCKYQGACCQRLGLLGAGIDLWEGNFGVSLGKFFADCLQVFIDDGRDVEGRFDVGDLKFFRSRGFRFGWFGTARSLNTEAEGGKATPDR